MTTVADLRVATSATPRHYIVEIQGLRTVAALLVAIYHIWFGRVSGGVDVFFVVAAYFMTSALLRIAGAPRARVAAQQAVAYLANVLRRVVPSAVTVIVATIGVTIVLLPNATWASQMKHALASTFFVENLWLAHQQTDYLSQGMGPSPFQQFWALALQMQFYVFWPLVALAAFGVARLSAWRFRAVLGTAILVIAACAFTYAIIMVQSQQAVAYFLPTTRAWEFAVGIGLALLTAKLEARPVGRHDATGNSGSPQSARRWAARAAGWASLGVLLSFAAVLDVSESFPGWAALVPVAAASGIVLTASAGLAPGVLRARPLVALAPFSFAFYLWHWPLLLVARDELGTQRQGLITGVAIIVTAWGLAWFTTRFLENPVRNSRLLKARPALSIVVCTALLAATASGVFTWYLANKNAATTQIDAAHQARIDALDETEVGGRPSLTLGVDLGKVGAPSSRLVPAPTIAHDDLPEGYLNGCSGGEESVEAKVCVYGDINSDVHVALVGGSRSLQWLPALDQAGKTGGFAVDAMTRSGCVFGDTSLEPTGSPTCQDWQRDAMDKLLTSKPNGVVMLASRAVQSGESIPQGYPLAMERLQAAGIPVIAIRDIPRFDGDVPTCVQQHPDDLAACSAARSDKLNDDLNLPEPLPEAVQYVDPTDLMCDAERCYGTRGDFLVYRDHSHVTATFALALAPRLLEAVQDALESQGQ